MGKIRTEVLEITFEEGGPEDGPAVLILHGWPDAPCGWLSSRVAGGCWPFPSSRGVGYRGGCNCESFAGERIAVKTAV